MNKKRAILYIVIFAIGFLLVSLWSFYLVIRPPKIIFNRTPADYGLPSEDVILTTQDGLKLSGWFVKGSALTEKRPSLETKKGMAFEGQKAIILIHGYP